MAADDLDADIVEQLRKLNCPEELLFSAMVTFSEEVADLSVEVALQWTNGETGHICSYANDSPTRGGAHVEGFSRALTEAVKAYAIASGLVASAGDTVLGEDIRQGLTAIIRTHCDDPWFEPIHDDGINGRKLGTVKMREFVYWTTRPRLSSWLEEHPTEANLIVLRAISAAQDRLRIVRNGVRVVEGTPSRHALPRARAGNDPVRVFPVDSCRGRLGVGVPYRSL